MDWPIGQRPTRQIAMRYAGARSGRAAVPAASAALLATSAATGATTSPATPSPSVATVRPSIQSGGFGPERMMPANPPVPAPDQTAFQLLPQPYLSKGDTSRGRAGWGGRGFRGG